MCKLSLVCDILSIMTLNDNVPKLLNEGYREILSSPAAPTKQVICCCSALDK